MNLETIIDMTEEIISSPSIYWQSLALICCFTLSYLIYKLCRRLLLPKIISRSLKYNIELNRFIVRYLVPLLYPSIAFLILTTGLSIYLNFFKEATLFETTLRLITLFIFLRFLRISSNSTVTANIVGLILMPALVLDVFGMLDVTIHSLDSLAFEVGNIKISVYIIVKGLIILILAFWLSGLISRKSKSLVNSSKSIKSSTKGIIGKAIDATVYSTVVIVILKSFGVDMTTFTVIGGAIGVGVGFGLQKIASNFISGVILLLEKSVEVGDIVEVDGGKIFGTVKHFAGRYTLVEELDGKEVMIPNEEFIINKVTNWTYSNNRARLEINVRVAYNSDLEQVKELMMNSAQGAHRCLNYPEVEWYVTGFGEYDIQITMFFWVSDILEGRLSPKSEVYMAIWREFKEHGIEIPYPQREVKFLEKSN
jgi:small-conductance mechanosensitive channel